MPRCYLFAVVQGSAVDSYSNNFTLFSLVEEVQVDQFPTTLPLEIHSYWTLAPDEVNVDFEQHLVVIPAAGDEVLSVPLPFRSPTPRLRIRSTGLRIPAPGSYELRIEWRESASPDWTRDTVFWPFEVSSPTGTSQGVAESPTDVPSRG
jgi:hypothetical protein